MKRMTILSVFVALLICFSSVAKSETISLTISDWSHLTRNNITYSPGGFNLSPIWAGSFKATGPAPDPFETYVFCVELTQGISGSTYVFDINQLTDLEERYRKIGWLIDQYEPIVSTTNSGALQLAIWEILYDDTFNLSGGNFIVNSTASFSPPSLLSDIATTFTAETIFDFDMNRFAVYSNEYAQNLIGLNAAPVPEPSTMLLFGTGLVGLAGWRLRKE